MAKECPTYSVASRQAWISAISTELLVLWGLTAPALGQQPARLPEKGEVWRTLPREFSIGTPITVSEAMVNERYDIRVGYKLRKRSELTISFMDARADKLYARTKFAEQERRPSDGEPLLNCSRLTPGQYFVVFTVSGGKPSDSVQSTAVRSVRPGAKPPACSNELGLMAGGVPGFHHKMLGLQQAEAVGRLVMLQDPTFTTSAAEKTGQTREKAQAEPDFLAIVSARANDPDLITMMDVDPKEGVKFEITYSLSRACKVFEEAREEDSDDQTWKRNEQNRLQGGPYKVQWDAGTAPVKNYWLRVNATNANDPDEKEYKAHRVRRK